MGRDVPAFLGDLIEIGRDTGATDTQLLAFEADAPRALPLEMPPQALSNWCWAATTASIQAFYQEPDAKIQCQVATFWLDKPCCPPGQDTPDNPRNLQYNLETALDRNLAAPALAAPLTMDEIVGEIDGRHPICCTIRWSNGDQHFNVIVGYLIGLGEVVVRDPKYAGDHQLPYAELRDRYRGDGQWVATLLTGKV